MRLALRVGILIRQVEPKPLGRIVKTSISENSRDRFPRVLQWLCGLPLASLLGIELYIRNFDGWGAWASAPLLLVPAIVSLPVVILGFSECVAAMRARTPLFATVLFTLVSAVPLVWLGVRRFFT